MNLINSIKNIFGNNAPDTLKEVVKNEKGVFTFKLKGQKVFNFQLGIDSLDMAIAKAEDLEFPSRIELYEIYQNLKDLHVKSQIRTAVFKVVSQPWVVVNEKTGKPNKELTKLFRKKWFTDLNEHIISNEFWGHTLVYFNTDLDSGEIKESKIFPRMHVLPERNSIIPDLSNPDLMFNYIETTELQGIFIEIKDTEPLGLLKDIARYSILKGYAISDWARSSEKWGDPLVTLKSSSQNDEEDDKKEEFLKNFGNNGYAIVNKEDELQLLERSSTGSSHKIFLDLIKMNNDENSIGINGQTATSTEKSFVGAAEVQERILNDYTMARLRDLMFFHNETTFPFLAKQEGSPYAQLKGHKWVPLALMDEDKEEQPKNNTLENVSNPFL